MDRSHTQPRLWDWAALGLHFILLQTVASRLVVTTWTPFLYLIQTFTYIGYVVGTALGYSQFKRVTVRWLTFFYMLLMLPLQWTLVIDQHASLEEQLASVAGRLFFSTSDFFARRPVEDPFFFVAVMSIVFWIISSWAGFALVRNQNYLGAVLPAATGLLIIQNYDNAIPGRLWFLAFFAFIALLLMGRLQLLQNQKSWRERRIFLSPDNRIDLSSSMAIAAGLIIILSWTIPASFSRMESAVKIWQRLTKPWQEFSQKMENSVSALESTSGGRPGSFFGSELQLGRGFPISDDIMFQVKAPTLPSEEKPPRYYWRGRIYDNFTKGQWYTTNTFEKDYSPDNVNPLNVNTHDKTPTRFVFHTGDTTSLLLYSPSQPIWVSRPGSISLSTNDEKDVVLWSAIPALLSGETYQVDAMLNNPNVQQLDEAETTYPEWVKNKYLQLPANFSPRIKSLAEEITSGADTPYAKAEAITRYLRDTIEYSATVAEAPRNKDPLEWMLFEYKKGYCVYYATSEVLMLRSLGIPARMAVGFAQGSAAKNELGVTGEEPAVTTYTVRKRDAHAWPEVYFPGIGWVEFEPTGNQSPLNRPLPPQDSTDGNSNFPRDSLRPEDSQSFAGREQGEQATDATTQSNTTVTRSLYLIALLLIFAALTIFLSRRYALATRAPVLVRATFERTGIEAPNWILRWEKWVGLSPIEKAFESINFGLRQLDHSAPIHTTPAERAQKLTRILPDKTDQIKVLLDEHQTSLYTSRVADVTQARRAAVDIRMGVIFERIRYLFVGKPLQ